MNLTKPLNDLAGRISGKLYTDHLSKVLYATDASAYREMPLAVAIPENNADLKELIAFALKYKTSLIPRGAGTSLAGQVVGNGIVVDISKRMNRILEVNAEEHWVRVEPGVVLSELNLHLKQFGLQFGPETSTANRSTMGGRWGNNRCGLHSLVYGSVREHVIEVDALLSDGSEVHFKPLTAAEYQSKISQNNLEGRIYSHFHRTLSNPVVQKEIRHAFPHPSVPRRNHGYALDALVEMKPFSNHGEALNLSKFIAGSEGTLAFATSMKLNLVPLPPAEKAVVCIHFEKLEQAFHANLIGLKYNPSAIELMDKTIMDCTKESIGLRKNRFFIQGEPEAILIVEFWANTRESIEKTTQNLEAELRASGYGFHFPVVWGADIPKVWGLRTAGLGVLSNIPGDAKPVSVIEDTAVPVQNLPNYIADFQKMLSEYNLKAVYHAHIATGELHLRPVLNLKNQVDVELFRKVATRTAELVKKYRGSLSGEHGDGRLRGEFIPFMLGQNIYNELKNIKNVWDPHGIFNPGKIVNTPHMDASLRFEPGQETPEFKTYFDYKTSEGFVRAIERCNGSADCLKSEIIGGTMCPSYMATRNELNSTRGRANVLREVISHPSNLNWADDHEIFTSLELCLSCKACKAECPSGVDMAKLKAEFLQNHYDANPVPFSTLLVAHYPVLMQWASKVPQLSNAVLSAKPLAWLVKKGFGFNTQRNLPKFHSKSLKFNSKYKSVETKTSNKKRVYLFNDEFISSTDTEVGMKAILLLENLGYEVVLPKHTFSGRTYISKGLVRKASHLANQNVRHLASFISDENPLIGIEPSAILSFRDEYLGLVDNSLKIQAQELSKRVFLIEEFLVSEFEKGAFSADQFEAKSLEIKLHGHCHQKAIAPSECSKRMLEIPVNYKVTTIPSGCCGMAGAFGYEKDHYAVSMKIGELVLFPEIRKSKADVMIAAPGTSCREQISHGTGKKALHPVEILYDALIK